VGFLLLSRFILRIGYGVFWDCIDSLRRLLVKPNEIIVVLDLNLV